MFNAQNEFQRYKDRYLSLRGGFAPAGKRASNGQLLVPPSKLVPATTWGDVLVFYNTFLAACDAGDFARTVQYTRAKEDWKKVSPAYVSPLFFAVKAVAEEVYPYNEEFWGYGSRYALERNAAGEVPGKLELAWESVKESAADLYGRLPSLPSLEPTAAIVKWSVIGGIALLGWWYVLRPASSMVRKVKR